MTWSIEDGESGRIVETHQTPDLAYRAMLLLSAHEVKNGRVAKYRVRLPSDFSPNADSLDLPAWVRDALGL